MGDVMLNGRRAEDFEIAAIEHGHRCELERDQDVVAGLVAEYPREPVPVLRKTANLSLDPLS